MTTHAGPKHIHVTEAASEITKNDRFSFVLVIVTFVVMFTIGLLMKQQSAAGTWPFSDTESGIEAEYPVGWLVEEGTTYVARIRDPKSRPFKTQLMLTVVPAGGQTAIRNVLDSLTLQRSVDLPAYRVIQVQEFDEGGFTVTQMDFVYVQTDPNPFIERLPVVVRGIDRIILDGNRAIIASYMADESTFETQLTTFERFVASLRY
jgi:hypothetical protein